MHIGVMAIEKTYNGLYFLTEWVSHFIRFIYFYFVIFGWCANCRVCSLVTWFAESYEQFKNFIFASNCRTVNLSYLCTRSIINYLSQITKYGHKSHWNIIFLLIFYLCSKHWNYTLLILIYVCAYMKESDRTLLRHLNTGQFAMHSQRTQNEHTATCIYIYVFIWKLMFAHKLVVAECNFILFI